MGKGNSDIFKALTYLFLGISMATYFVPVIKVGIPPLGGASWSVHDVVKMVPKGMSNKSEKSSFDFNFMDVLKKILPKSNHQKLSPTFIIGILVPAALIAAYVLTFFNFFLAQVKKRNALFVSTALSAVLSIYALLGTYYLGLQARAAFEHAINKASQGIFGVIAKNFVPQNVIQPDSGLYLLVIFTLLSFIATIYRKHA